MKLFDDRQLAVDETVIGYVALRIERSFAAAQAVVAHLDDEAMRHKRPLTRAFAAELGKHSIRVNSVHPGPVFTEMGSKEMVAAISKAAEADGNQILMNMLTPFLPNWVAQPEDIADAVCWLASAESKLVTAQEISVDQGSTRY